MEFVRFCFIAMGFVLLSATTMVMIILAANMLLVSAFLAAIGGV